MATLAPYNSHPHPLPGSAPSPGPEYITYSKSEPEFHDSSLDHDSTPLTGRIRRSGSPTPSEKEELKEYDGLLKKAFRKESYKNKKFVVTIIVIIILIVITILLSVLHKQIVTALLPAAKWVKQAPAGWLIPIALLVILSIPPLFGAEIVHVLCGMFYGLGIGFLLVCAGTVLGEMLTFLMFRYCLRSRADKLERGGSSPQWAALARVIREGGFWVALVIRYSAIPTHIGTALFAACGMNFWVFLLTLVLSLPRQLAGVYIGVLAEEDAEGRPSKTDKTISTVVLVITIVITVIAMRWISGRVKAAALTIIRERRAREAAEVETKSFNRQALYDPANATSDTWTGTTSSNVYFGTRTPSPVPPNLAGASMPVAPGPAQIHVQTV
ncbi:Tlg2-vesicle protein [Ceratobasidium sp. 423]|nr:Tlg2-vesicle protein [Ceratobasidium sp. 423]